ncbi:MAG: hypothetical protein Q8O83_01555 [bacterium]|nr:hypothetical protein [bacterium]
MSFLGGVHPAFIIGGLIFFIFTAAGIGIKIITVIFPTDKKKSGGWHG